MRRKISLAFAVLIAVITLLPTAGAYAKEDTPSLVSISFKNAKIDSPFKEDVHEYTLTLDDNTAPPTLESYSVKGDADIFINYNYDETNHQTGVTATLQYDAGSSIYTFTYSNPAEYEINANNCLASVYSFYAELSPKLNSNDTAYKMYIPSDLTQLEITPVTEDINAYCAPISLTLSEKQTPKITLTCTASDGSKRNYTFTIKRVDKTTQQVKLEMAEPGYVSFVEGTRLHEKPEFIVTLCAVAGGIIIIILLYAITKRFAVNPYDKEEKPFYSSVE